MIACARDLERRELGVEALDLLQAQHVGLGLVEPGEQMLDSRALTELTFQVATLTKPAQPTENELPQPQEDAALGLRTWK